MMIADKIEPFLKSLKGAIHVGANIGEERDWYAKMGFSNVLWFEPNMDLFSELQKNIKPFPGQEAFNIGIHDTLTSAKLHVANNNGQSSSILPFGTHRYNHPTVLHIKDIDIQLTRLDSFFEKTGKKVEDYNFLNIDVEGVELNVLKSLGDKLALMDYLYIEIHTWEVYVGNSLLVDVEKYLSEYKFIRAKVKMTKANYGDAFYIKEGSL